MKIVLKYPNLPPYLKKMLKAEWEFHLWDTHREFLNLIEEIEYDRNIRSKLPPEFLQKLGELKEKVVSGEPALMFYEITEKNGVVYATLHFPDYFVVILEQLKKTIPLPFRWLLNRFANFEVLKNNMVKVAREYYGKEVEGWIEN